MRCYSFDPLSLFLAGLLAQVSRAQPHPDELAPLYRALAAGPSSEAQAAEHPTIQRRVPLSTSDDTVSPLIDLQVYAPPVVPRSGSRCTVELLRHDFGDGSYNNPAIVPYGPPTDEACGTPGNWAAVTFNLTVYSCVYHSCQYRVRSRRHDGACHRNGTQYDRLSVSLRWVYNTAATVTDCRTIPVFVLVPCRKWVA